MKVATKEQKARWQLMIEYGCMVCGAPPCIHHCETGMGRKKDHNKTIPLCHYHHQGAEGLHHLGRRAWEAKYGTEQMHMETISAYLEGVRDGYYK